MSANDPVTIGRYQVVSLIGRGGMATVYLARDPAIDRQVAIKLLRDEFADDEVRDRFAREARTAGGLRHANIVTIFDIGEHEGQPFIAMEYVEGETLAALIQRNAPMPLSQKVDLMGELCAGLHYAHSVGVVHRDIKPGNIIVGNHGGLKILDFGIARVGTSSLTRTGTMMGTPQYMAPEQLRGEPTDRRTDIFAVGAVFYEWLSYRKPFVGDSMPTVMLKVLQGSPEPLDRLVPGLEPVLVAIVDKCLEKDPERRYSDLATTRRDLAAVRSRLNDEPRLEPASSASIGAVDATLLVLPDEIGSPARQDPSPVASDGTVLIPPPAGATVADQSAAVTVPNVQLVVIASPDAELIGRSFPILRSHVVIGRASSCDIVLMDRGWSREHAVIDYSEEGFRVRDVSANGTYVNGQRVSTSDGEPLFFGASIRVGQTLFTFSHRGDTTLPDLTTCEIAGRYTLQRLLRQSAKGAVYAARDRHVGHEIAIKLFSPELLRYSGYREQFRREAELVARLEHPHICKVLDYGETDVAIAAGAPVHTCFLCLELMVGGNLADRLESKEPIPLDVIRQWVTAISDALEHAHRRGVIHGNLKPSAIVFDAESHAYLGDFSVATGDGRTRLATGTPAYMAPEVWDDGTMTPVSDQFALAALTYYMVTGSQPFVGQDNPEVRRNNFRRSPIPAHEEAAHNGRGSVSRAVSAVLAKAMSIQIDSRYASIGSFATAFDSALQGLHQPGVAPRIFLSYERESSGAWAVTFARELKRDYEIDVFIDTQRLDRAEQFPTRLARAIEECDVFVCLLARHTLESRHVNNEIQLAHQCRKPMIPVFQESFDHLLVHPDGNDAVETLLSYDGVHLFDRKAVHIDHTVSDLARMVKSSIRSK